jgi:hypothetical protein
VQGIEALGQGALGVRSIQEWTRATTVEEERG